MFFPGLLIKDLVEHGSGDCLFGDLATPLVPCTSLVQLYLGLRPELLVLPSIDNSTDVLHHWPVVVKVALTSIGLEDDLGGLVLGCVERVLVWLWTAALGDLARMRSIRMDGRAKSRQECAVRVHSSSDVQHSILLFLFWVVLCETMLEIVVKIREQYQKFDGYSRDCL